MYSKVIVPLDGSELVECVLPHIESIAKGCGVRDVIFVHVVEPFRLAGAREEDAIYISQEDVQRIDSENIRAANDYITQIAARVRLDGTNISSEVIVGKAADSIADYATRSGAELIVIATHGRSGVSRWVYGSVADRILRSSCVPVLMVRAPGCVPGI